ncbi:hypothetical protein GCM10018790_05730 [Kitasatospora xanthocidica]|uniref:hypothetical protein n=1 Tax=Kitasatospora xanthocidica TaxID=83382 RepID=UPI001671F960|nr:hypothetical protein [Kitasatospora xanthocidica]GHF30977.1 hypothetical protein GCM10018790_05730 [Kitasatospora xanthocidica]
MGNTAGFHAKRLSRVPDPAERLTGLLLTQRMFETATPPPVARDFETLAYQALAG